MSDKHIDNLISLYLDDELTKREQAEMQQHLAVCVRCRERLQKHQAVEVFVKTHVHSFPEHPSTNQLLDYTDNKLEEAENTGIAAHVRQCETCRKLLDSASILQAIPPDIEMDLSASHSIKTIMWEKVRTLRSSRSLVPGGIAIAVVIIMFFLLRPTSNPYSALATITPAPYIRTEVRGEETAGAFEQGMALYSKREFQTASPLLQTAVAAQPDNPQRRFFLGVTSLLNEQYKKGLTHLSTQVVARSVYREEAMWYAAQANLKLNEPEHAKALLQQLGSQPGKLSQKARELLQQVSEVERHK